MRIAKITEAELIAVAEGRAGRELTELVQRAAVENSETARSLAVWRAVAASAGEMRDESRDAAGRIARRVRMRTQYERPAAETAQKGLAAWFQSPVAAGFAVVAVVCLGVATMRGGASEAGSDRSASPAQVAYRPAVPRDSTRDAMAAVMQEIQTADAGAVIRIASGKLDESIRINKPLRLVRAQH